jgi:hypothetical protein
VSIASLQNLLLEPDLPADEKTEKGTLDHDRLIPNMRTTISNEQGPTQRAAQSYSLSPLC